MPLLAIPYGSGSASYLLRPVIFWFFPCLMSSQLLLWVVMRVSQGYLQCAIVVFMVFAGWYVGVHRSWLLAGELEDAFVVIIFVYAGFLARRHLLVHVLVSVPRGFALFLFLLGACSGLLNSSVDVRTSRYGNLFLFLIASFLFILGLIVAVNRLPRNRLVELVARNSILVFPLHVFVFSILAAIYVYVLRLPLAVRQVFWVGLVASLVNVVVIIAISPFFKRYLPLVYGLRGGGMRG